MGLGLLILGIIFLFYFFILASISLTARIFQGLVLLSISLSIMIMCEILLVFVEILLPTIRLDLFSFFVQITHTLRILDHMQRHQALLLLFFIVTFFIFICDILSIIEAFFKPHPCYVLSWNESK